MLHKKKSKKNIKSGYIMEMINYNGSDGVFLSNSEVEYIKSSIENNNLLLIGLISYIQQENISPFDFLLKFGKEKKF